MSGRGAGSSTTGSVARWSHSEQHPDRPEEHDEQRLPYAERFAVNRTFPGARPRTCDDIIDELSQMAKEEDAFWETGQVWEPCTAATTATTTSSRAFGLFAHVNVLQRHVPERDASRARSSPWPSTCSRGRHRRRRPRRPGHERRHGLHLPCRAGLPRPRPRHPRDHQTQLRQARDRPPAFDKACHLFGGRLRVAPVDPATTRWTSRRWPS